MGVEGHGCGPERAEGARNDAKLVSSLFWENTYPLRFAGAQHLPHEWGRWPRSGRWG